MKKLKLVLGLHNGQPVGTSNEQFEHAYQFSYKPFLTVLYKYPKVRTALHFSGVLYEWFEDKHPEYMMLINEMVKRRQVELVGGAFYSPALPIIPSKDRVGQMELLTTYIRRRFGKRPRGCWITEGVWEPSIASTIKSSGMEYLFIDDVYFEQAGIPKHELYTPFVTDDQGKSAVVLPLHNDLISTAFEGGPEEYIAGIQEIQKAQPEQERLVSIMWNGEYFYSTPQRYQEVFSENGWLESFFHLLSQNGQTIQTILPGKYLRNVAPYRRVYFPGSLYLSDHEGAKSDHDSEEKGLQEWNSNGLTTATCRRAVKNYFRKNIVHYPESGRLYGKMMYVHLIVGQVRRDRSRKKTAKEESWKGQGHVPFWHAPGGGIYDNRIRKAAYSSLIEAEKTTREKGIFSTTVNVTDIDLDGADEFLYQGQFINAYVHRRGGAVFELDYVVTAWNYQDVMARYREPYHDEEDEKNGFDTGPRSSFVDHLFAEECSLEDYLQGRVAERSAFAEALYYPKKVDKEHKDLELEVHRWIKADGAKVKERSETREKTEAWRKTENRKKGAWLHLNKHYDFQKNSINVRYRLQAEKGKKVQGLFSTELNLSFPESDKERLVYSITGEDGSATEVFDGKIDFRNVTELSIHDRDNRTLITLTPSESAALWVYPVYTITKRYGVKQRIYQGSCYMFLWKCTVENDSASAEHVERSISIRIEKR